MKNVDLGDIVSVNFNNAQYTLTNKARVIKIPYSTGDTWGFEDAENGKIHYVSEGCTITIIAKSKKYL
jgi:hypothetical protein